MDEPYEKLLVFSHINYMRPLHNMLFRKKSNHTVVSRFGKQKCPVL